MSIPSNICWSWRRLQHAFTATVVQFYNFLEKLLHWRRLQNVLRTYLADVMIHILKTPWRRFLKMSSRRLGDKWNIYWGYQYLVNLSVYIFDLTNLYLTNLYPTNLRRIKNALIIPNNFEIHLILKDKQYFYFTIAEWPKVS